MAEESFVLFGIPVSLSEVKDFLSGSLEQIIAIALIFIFTVIIARIVSKILQKVFEKSSRIIKVDNTHYTFLRHTISGIIYVIGISIAVYIIPQLRALSVSLLAGAGVLAIIIGFASQQAFANIISGVFIVLFRPFRVGDKIKIKDVYGTVEDITLRHTVIRNFENKRIIIPNSVISNENIENMDIGDPQICRFVEFGISYDSDIDLAMKILQEEALSHPNTIDHRSEDDKKENRPIVPVRVMGFGDSSVKLRAWVWTNNTGDAFRLGCDLNKSIKERFDAEGVEIPFPYRTVVYKKDLPRNRKIRRAK